MCSNKSSRPVVRFALSPLLVAISVPALAQFTDSDGDGVIDDLDNCLLVANSDQRDTNLDGFGNLCDTDLNNDGVVAVADLGVMRTLFFSDDPDADFNGDGVVNVQDLGIMRSTFFGPPGPSGTNRSETLFVFGNDVGAEWDNGIGAADSTTPVPFEPYFDGATTNQFNWQIVSEGVRGNVIEVAVSELGGFGNWFIQSSAGVDLRRFAGGQVAFDVRVTDYGMNTVGMTMKIDCSFPCTSGDVPLGRVGELDWETVQVPVVDLVNRGLDLGSVNTGISLYPGSVAADQSGGIVYRVDRVLWEEGPIDLPVDFDQPGTEYLFGDAGGQITVRTVRLPDGQNGLARTRRGDQPTAATTIALGSAVPFTANRTALGLDVIAPAAGVPIRLQLGRSSDPSVTVFTDAMTSTSQQVESLRFDFAEPAAGSDPFDVDATYDTITVAFDPGSDNGGDEWFWDNLDLLQAPGFTLIDDFEDGDSSNWIPFGGPSSGGGCGAVNVDVFGQFPAEGQFYFNTGWGGNGTASGFYGGCTLRQPTSSPIALPADPHLNLFIRNEQTVTPFVDGYTLEITLREDNDGDGYTAGVDDEIIIGLPFTTADFTPDWIFVSLPLSDFVPGLGVGDGVFDGDLAQLTLGIAGIDGAPGTTVEADFDFLHFTTGPGAPPSRRPLVGTLD